MKAIIIFPYGRSGSDLLQSLFDNHKEISQFPGVFFWTKFYQKIRFENNIQRIADIFVNDYKIFFDSRLNKIERHEQLGEKKNSFYQVNNELFKNNFIALFKDKILNKKNIFFNLHLAYSLSCGESIEKKKIIVINLHHLELYKDFEDINHEVILTIRNPMAALSSSAKGWFGYKSGKHTSPWQCYYFINRVFRIFKILIEKKISFHVVKLESLHLESQKTLKNLSKTIGINYDQSLLRSSYHGKKWWGDSLSIKYLDGLNPYFKNNIDYNYFYKKDIILIKHYLHIIFINFDYEKEELRKNIYLINLIKLLPLKIELLFLKKEIKSFNLKNIILFFFYWFKRVKIMKEDVYKDLNLPKDVTKL
jgi:hypothetical protein